jgi:hypothetical protein
MVVVASRGATVNIVNRLRRSCNIDERKYRSIYARRAYLGGIGYSKGQVPASVGSVSGKGRCVLQVWREQGSGRGMDGHGPASGFCLSIVGGAGPGK